MIEIKNLTVGYGERAVLQKTSAVFEKGMLTSVIGTNGCGKSTLLKTLAGILPFSEGEILLGGVDIRKAKRIDIAKRVSYLAQGKSAPDMSVFQMVLHGRFPHLGYPRRYTSLDREIAYSAMQRVGISDLADKPMSTLSGGMRQNAYIAMALAQDTDYILLDEPTTYLDIAHRLELMRILRELADDGKGVVAVMHDLPLAFSFSDKITLINNHKVIAEEEPRNLAGQSVIEDVFGVKIKVNEENEYSYQY